MLRDRAITEKLRGSDDREALYAILTDSNGGHDTINAAAVTGSGFLDMVPGQNSTIAGNTLTIAAGTVIEDAFLGDGNDTVTGNSADNVILGGRGNDSLDGAAGTDTALYFGAFSGFTVVTVDPTHMTVTDIDLSNINEGTDTLANFEFIQFSDFLYVLNAGPPNSPPVANADSPTTNEDNAVTVAVLTNDTDADGDILSVTNKTDGAHGTVVINPDNTVTYTPNANYNGSDNFTYTASDGLGGNTVGTVNVAINPVNDPPVAVGDSANTTQDVPVTIPVLVNDTDVENDPLSVTGTTNPAHGAVVINPDNTVTYTPASGYSGADSFGYTISDGHGGTASASVALTVNPPPLGPVTLISETFDSDAGGFAYRDDAFLGTSKPAYESGTWVSSGGVSGGALDISLGGINNANVSGMSGGFDHGFALSGFTDMVLTFTYNLTQSPHYEPNEFSQVLVSVDGVLYGTNGNAYVDQISGNGNGGPSISTGWVTVTIDLGVLAAGDHTLTIGGYNNHKDSRNESTDLAIDDVNLSTNPGSGTLALDATAPQGASATDSADSGMTLKPGDVLETDHDSSVLGTGTAGNDAPAPSTDYPETVFTPSISDTLTSLVDDQTVQAACAA